MQSRFVICQPDQRISARLSRAIRISIVAVIAGFVITSCITQDSRLANYPEKDRTLYLQNFGNTTFEADVQVELTEAIRTHIHLRQGYLLTDERNSARFILFGDIVLYRREGHLFDNEFSPIRYDLTLVVRVRLIDRESGNTVTAFEEDARAQYSTKEGLVETEQSARRRLYSSICRKIYNRLSEAYPAY